MNTEEGQDYPKWDKVGQSGTKVGQAIFCVILVVARVYMQVGQVGQNIYREYELTNTNQINN